MELEIIMPYIGKDLSVNSYKIVGKGGLRTNKTKKHVVVWMEQLAEKVKGSGFGSDIELSLYGEFYDNRAPDLHNLHKVIGDAVKSGLNVDDKNFRFVDLGYKTGYDRPRLFITIREV